ncbi:hypothetical protein DSO57_1029223 [Entomophthora muscae]|uniref:Uncharacterized protein n=1 Tax=Entomophthora muscae TaxID=34485 RepID=A0ACC2ULB2_9FUNG|nr:hypothetical protein DSO57_1029223 [Entomophthora muscae]
MASDLATFLMDTLADFQITDKVFTITSDLSPTMQLLIDELLRISAAQADFNFHLHHHIPCLGYVINEVVNGVLQIDLNSLPLDPKAAIESLKDFGGMASGSILERISFLREGMAAFRLSPKKLVVYQSYFKHNDMLYQEPLVDTPGDWESTYAMVERAISIHKPYNFACSTFGLSHLIITQENLAFLGDIKAFLALFQAFSARISTARYPSLTMATVMRERLLKHLQSIAPQKSPHIRAAYEFSHRAFAVYYSQGFATEIYPMAMALDPRLKFAYWNPPVCSHAEAEMLRGLVKAYWDMNSDAVHSQSISLPPQSGFDDVFDIDSELTSDELVRYSQESVINTGFSSEVEVLEFWKRSCLSFPHLSKIAQKFLAIPISSNPCEKRHVHTRQETSSFAANQEMFKLKSEFSLLRIWRNALECHPS